MFCVTGSTSLAIASTIGGSLAADILALFWQDCSANTDVGCTGQGKGARGARSQAHR